MATRTCAAALLIASLAACGGAESPGARPAPDERPAPGARPAVLRDVPVVAGSQLVDSTGTDEALSVRFLVNVPRDSVAGFYRRVLAERGWRIVGDAVNGEMVQLYAERDGPPLWIQIRSAGPGVTHYALIGAQAQDSSAGRPR
ncbi:MAG: hypothetical protein Q7J79_11175 [Gemmatimonadales bacterium]|nr:hypothetical protein [Gemmatimonadales bacterium]